MRNLMSALLIGLITTAVQAAGINWGSPFELVSDADIDLTYPVVYAHNAGDLTGNPNVLDYTPPAVPLTADIAGQPLAFDHVEAIYGVDASFGQLGFPFESFGDAIDHLPGGGENVTYSTTDWRTVPNPQVTFDGDLSDDFNRNYTISTGNNELDILLNSQVFFDGRSIGSSALNISLNNLTPGVTYQVQVIGAANSSNPTTVTLDDGLGNSVAGLSGFADLDSDTNSHVTSVLGTFTADSTSQAINAVLEDNRNSGISGLILTQVPEPTTLTLLSLSLLISVRRRA